MISPVRDVAVGLTHSVLGPSDRVLVTGAGGWFGSTVAALLHGGPAAAMYLTQRPRTVDYGLGRFDAVAWDLGAIRDFAPTVVVDCAFVLRDYIGSTSLAEYVHVNTVLTGRLLQLAQLPEVRAVVSVSSGAAVHRVDASRTEVDIDPYGYLKRQAELALSGLAGSLDAAVVVARPWSLSGCLVTRPDRYAFSDLVLQVRSGVVSIRAGHQVLRRYLGVDDFFAVALAQASVGSATLDSGGELFEVGDLAQRIAQVLGVQISVERADVTDAPPDDYYARSATWDTACAAVGYAPADVDEQIHTVDAYLRSRRTPSPLGSEMRSHPVGWTGAREREVRDG